MLYPLLLGIIALLSVVFKSIMGTGCPSCSATTTYLPLLSAGYFSVFLICIFFIRLMPSPSVKWAGLLWSTGLALSLTYLSPIWCIFCLIAHICHIGMWVFWNPREKKSGRKTHIAFSLFVASILLIITTLFDGKSDRPEYEATVLLFLSPQESHCEEEIIKLNKIASDFSDKKVRFIGITPQLSPDWMVLGSNLDWIEDVKENLISQFHIQIFPTTVVLDADGNPI